MYETHDNVKWCRQLEAMRNLLTGCCAFNRILESRSCAASSSPLPLPRPHPTFKLVPVSYGLNL